MVRTVWRKGDKSPRMFKCVFIGLVVVCARGVCCSSQKPTPDKPASVGTVHDWPLKIPDTLHLLWDECVMN